MRTQRWLVLFAILTVVLAALVVGWVASAQVQQRMVTAGDALDQQKLKVSQVAENGRIVADLVFGELRQALKSRTKAAPMVAGRVEQYEDHYLEFVERNDSSTDAAAALQGVLIGLGAAQGDRERTSYQSLLSGLYGLDKIILGRSWSSRVVYTYFMSKDQLHVVCVPTWDFGAAVRNSPLKSAASAMAELAAAMLIPYPGELAKGQAQIYRTDAWVDSTDGRALQTFVSPLYDLQGTWLGNAAVDFALSEVDKVLGNNVLPESQWLLVTQNKTVLARSIDPKGEFGKLLWGHDLKTSVVPLPDPSEGTVTNSGRYAVRVSLVPGSNLFLYQLVPTAWLYQDLSVTVGVGLTALLLLAFAFGLLGWLQKRNEALARRGAQEAQTQVTQERDRRDQESGIKSDLSTVSGLLHQTTSRPEFAQVVLRAVSEYSRANYGAFYVVEGVKVLTPVGAHGVVVGELAACRVGEGLLGECAKSQRVIGLRGQDAESFRLTWGQGTLRAVAVDLLPIVQSETVLGVLVLGYLQASTINFELYYGALLPMVALNLEILGRNLATIEQAKALERQQSVLKETEAWSRGIIESSPDGLLVVEASGTIIMTNHQAEVIFGYETGELIGQSIDLLVPNAVRPRHGDLRQGFVHGEAQRAKMGIDSRDLRAVTKDGQEIQVEIGLTKLPALADSGTCVCAWVKPIVKV